MAVPVPQVGAVVARWWAMATLIPQTLAFADTAPVIAESTATIDGTPAEVWATILVYERWPEWFPSVKTCRSTSEPATGVGSTRTVTIPGGMSVDERFIAWDEPEVWAFTALTGPPVFQSLVERITIRPVGDDRSEVTYRMAIEPKRGFGGVLKVARSQIAKTLAGALRNLDGEVARTRSAAG